MTGTAMASYVGAVVGTMAKHGDSSGRWPKMASAVVLKGGRQMSAGG